VSGFLERNRGLVFGAAGVVAAALAVELLVVQGRFLSAAAEVEKGNAGLEEEIGKLSSRGVEVSKALAGLKTERERLEGLRRELGGVLLDIPEKSRYRVPPGRRNDALFYFQEQHNILRKERTDGRPYPAEAPLGFSPDIQTKEKDKPELLLERLAAVDRLTAAVQTAGLAKVSAIRHGELRAATAKGVKDMHLAVLPMHLSATADERSLVAFLTEISREGNFLALESMQVEVTGPKARTFKLEADVCALIERRTAPPKDLPGRVTRPLPIGRY
jgi:hypothetical protein